MDEQNRKIFERIEKILMQHGERLAKIEEQNGHIRGTIDDIWQRLFGNGQEGLIRTVERHRTYFALLGAAVTTLVGIVVSILVKILL